MARPERLLGAAPLALRAAGKAGVLRSLRSLVELNRIRYVGSSNTFQYFKHTEARARRASVCLARPERFELPTAWFVARYSIQLSYGRVDNRRGIIQKNLRPSWPHRQDLRIISSGPAGGWGTHRNGWSLNELRHPRMSGMPGAGTQGPRHCQTICLHCCLYAIVLTGDWCRAPITPAIRRQDQRPGRRSGSLLQQLTADRATSPTCRARP